MSTQDAAGHEEDHTGPIKTPTQVMWVSLAALAVPIFIIIALVYYVASANKPAAGAIEIEKATAARIAKIGAVEIRDANRELKAGKAVYEAQCAACHNAGAAGAPKFADEGAWSARLKTGYDALLNSALKGKGSMGAQGGGDFDDVEIARAVVYLANSAGGKFPEPKGAAPAAAAAAPAGDDAAAKAAAAQVAAAVATAAPAAGAQTVSAAAGEALYKQACTVCHAAGVANAPKTGDKAAWAPRISTGVPALVAAVVKGKGAMPPKGGAMNASEAEIKAAVEYMIARAK